MTGFAEGGVPCQAAGCDLPAVCLVAVLSGTFIVCRTNDAAYTRTAPGDEWPTGPACHEHAVDAFSDALLACKHPTTTED